MKARINAIVSQKGITVRKIVFRQTLFDFLNKSRDPSQYTVCFVDKEIEKMVQMNGHTFLLLYLPNETLVIPNDRYEQISCRLRKASPFPWEWVDESESSTGTCSPSEVRESARMHFTALSSKGRLDVIHSILWFDKNEFGAPDEYDADFLANAPQDMFDLLAHTRILEAKLNRLQFILKLMGNATIEIKDKQVKGDRHDQTQANGFTGNICCYT